jgi:hypothetical protein
MAVVGVCWFAQWAQGWWERHHDESPQGESSGELMMQRASAGSPRMTGHLNLGGPRELTKNMWSFFVVAATNKAQTYSGRRIPVTFVGLGNFLLAFSQMFTIFLLVHDIDPHSDPVTETPSSPWKKTTWTVNCMKWLQVTFMATALASEVSQAMQLFAIGLLTPAENFRCHRVFLLLMAMGQYMVTIWVLFGGVSVVLSFQAVPDILYSSMAIVFVNSIDDLMYEFVESVFEIDADFHFEPERTRSSRGSIRRADEYSGEGDALQEWLPFISRVVSVFPLVFAIFLMGESWYYNKMPNAWIRKLTHEVRWW